MVLCNIEKCVVPFYRCIFLPWGLRRGLKQTKKKVAKNVLLEEAYKQGGSDLPHSKITGLAKQLDWSVRQVEQWYENIVHFSILAKFVCLMPNLGFVTENSKINHLHLSN